jgi:hypothetical protein
VFPKERVGRSLSCFENAEADMLFAGRTGVSKTVLLAALHGTLRLCELSGSNHFHGLHKTTSIHGQVVQMT